jgi:hypothetical protein
MARFLEAGQTADNYGLELLGIRKVVLVNFLQNAPGRSGITSVAAALFLFTFLSGCGGGEKREYAVPEKLCDMPTVDMDALLSFLPPGKELTMHPKSVRTEESCEVQVDGKTVLRIMQDWLPEGEDTALYARGVFLKTPKKSVADGRYLYSDRDGFGKADGCVDGHSKEELYTAIQVYSEHRDADAMKRVIVNFTEAVQRSTACNEGPAETFGNS